MTRKALIAALDEATSLAGAGATDPAVIAALLHRIFDAAADTPEVAAALRDVAAGRALLRATDGAFAIEFQAGDGRLHAEAADAKGKGPKVDASAVTWLGLMGGTLKPWLAFTRGMVIVRAGVNEIRWLQQVAERLQQAYADARAAEATGTD